METLKLINKLLVGLIVLAVFFLAVGIAYAYFAADVEGVETNTTITAEAGYMNIVYNGDANINAAGIGPSTAPFATKTFTVKGTSTLASAEMGYKLTLIIVQNTFTDNAISCTLNSTNTGGNGTVVPKITERQNLTNQNKILGTGKFSGIMTNSIHTYELKVYFYESGTDQTVDMEKIFKAYVNIEKYDPCTTGECLKDKILAQGGGKAAIVAKGTPDFSKIAVSQSTYDSLPATATLPAASKATAAVENGLYAAEDEYGISYYYRGERSLLNNNLLFGGFQWKIIRINGDGSIRIIYNGTEAQFTVNSTMNTTGIDTQISGNHAWNTTYSNDAKYLGYMYGGANGTASTSRDGAILNETSSNAKVQLDTWYQTNIANKVFEYQIVDNLFCNDRQLQNEVGGGTNGPGYGNTDVTTYYASHYRLGIMNAPTLRCNLKNDRFTKSNITLGNGLLAYPVGLITVDEAAMSGLGYNSSHSTNYLYTNQSYWTFSPSDMYSLDSAYIWRVYPNGSLLAMTVNTSMGIRAVLNLSRETIATGDGSSTNPYRVS